MAWTYSGDPMESEIDRYRFLVGDTNALEPLLQDEEIQFILDGEEDEKARLAQLFGRLVLIFSRMPSSRSLGPMAEAYKDRLFWFKQQYAYYQSSAVMAAPVMSTGHQICFTVGMHDHKDISYEVGDEDV